jgi:predicted metalloendopeptidase
MGGEEELLVAQPSAYTGMAAVFADTPVETWRDYFTYRLLRNNAAFLPKKVDETHFEFVSALSGAEQQRERWKRGVQLINGAIGEAVGQLYVERYFSARAKERIDELVGNLLAAFAMRIETLDWMSEETKAEAREKLAKFTVKIGYPDEWRDYTDLEIRPGDLFGNVKRAQEFGTEFQLAKLGRPVDRDEWLMTPQTVNAYYNPNLNEIVFPAAILQPPFFDPWADDAVNYGAIGAVIGHEIGHGFDDQGRKYDGDGILRDWWTEKDAERFGKKTDVLVAQYDGYSPIEGMNVNGEFTLGENIGDLGGLEISYHAYHLSLDGKEAPVIDGLTGDQRFFLGFAQIWRGKMRDQIMAVLLASDPHSPVEFRVNGTLRNVDAWYAAFDVTDDHAMYLPPEDRVHIW